jgi:predicted component of type VI protein secretion system
MKLMRTFAGALVSIGVCAALLAACNDDDAPAVTPAADVAPTVTADAGAAPDAGPVAVPLTVWVNDLVTTFGPMSAPDTVDDKIIMDTEDPAAFDQILQ